MHALVLLWCLLLSETVVCCQNCRSRDVQQPSDSSNSRSRNREMLEKNKELRKLQVRFQVLSKLNRTEPNPPAQPASTPSSEVIQLLMSEVEEQSRRQLSSLDDSDKKRVIHAESYGQPCMQYNGSFCKMFQYELDPSLNMSAVFMWIYKLATQPTWVSVSLTLSSSSEDKYHENMDYEVNKAGWNKLQLPRVPIPPSWNDSVFYSAEITGQNIEDTGDRRPFLLVPKLSPVPVRRRRDVDCNTNDSCCLKPLRLSFAEIGFSWVHYPEEFNANMCIGKCTLDHSAMRTHYERAMAAVLESNSSLRASLGECWTLCCKPKELETIRVLYSDIDGIVNNSNITALSIKSCACS